MACVGKADAQLCTERLLHCFLSGGLTHATHTKDYAAVVGDLHLSVLFPNELTSVLSVWLSGPEWRAQQMMVVLCNRLLFAYYRVYNLSFARLSKKRWYVSRSLCDVFRCLHSSIYRRRQCLLCEMHDCIRTPTVLNRRMTTACCCIGLGSSRGQSTAAAVSFANAAVRWRHWAQSTMSSSSPSYPLFTPHAEKLTTRTFPRPNSPLAEISNQQI